MIAGRKLPGVWQEYGDAISRTNANRDHAPRDAMNQFAILGVGDTKRRFGSGRIHDGNLLRVALARGKDGVVDENAFWVRKELGSLHRASSLRRNSRSSMRYLKALRPLMNTTGTSSLNFRRSSADESTSTSRH